MDRVEENTELAFISPQRTVVVGCSEVGASGIAEAECAVCGTCLLVFAGTFLSSFETSHQAVPDGTAETLKNDDRFVSR